MTSSRGHNTSEIPALDLAEAALHLCRTAPASALASYYIGSVPFMVALLFFWADMSRSAFAVTRCFHESLGLAALFLWMKVWQSVFGIHLRARLMRGESPAFGFRRVLRLIVSQAALQPYGLVAIPFSMLLMLPFYAVHSFFMNLTVLADGSTLDLRASVGRAWRQAVLWPRQNHILIWLFSPWGLGTGMLTMFGTVWLMLSVLPELHEVEVSLWFAFSLILIFQFVFPFAPLGCVVAGNIGLLLVLLPSLLQIIFGVETLFTLSGEHAILNTTFLMSIFALSYLCLDPLMKAAYLLRCFHGESQTTGQDLRVELADLHRARQAGDRT